MKLNKSQIKIISLCLLISIMVLLVTQTSLARYIYNAINEYILEAQHFYFNSTILTANGKTYNVSNWDGVNAYSITIDVNSKRNELVATNSDISYDITYDCPSTVTCSLSKTTGVIYTAAKTDSYILTVMPLTNFHAGDYVSVTTTATSNYPYTKALSATYNIGVDIYQFSYSITDSVGSKYLTLVLTNAKPYYTVKTAFLSYAVGDQISLNTYATLSATNQAYCVSKTVTITFDTNDILLDLNSDIYLNKISETTTTLNTYTYVNGLTFNIPANGNTAILFYKNDLSMNYSSSTTVL